MYVMTKILVSAIVIAAVTEIAKKLPTYGGLIAALPLVSLLSLIWLYVQGESSFELSKFALGVLWGFPATAVMLLIVYLLLKSSFNIYLSISVGLLGWFCILCLQGLASKYFKIIP